MDDHNTFAAGGTSMFEDRTVAALFDSQGEAESAHDALRTSGFSNVVISRKSEDDHDDKGLWQSIKDFFSGHNDSEVYGEGIRRGKVLVTVHANGARVFEAVEILDRYAPLDLESHEKSWRDEGWRGESVEPGAMPGHRDLDGGNVRIRSYVRELG